MRTSADLHEGTAITPSAQTALRRSDCSHVPVVPEAETKPNPPQKKKKSKIVISFNIIKGVYIFMLLPYHIHGIVTPSYSPYASKYLPYKTVDHGVEFMFGLLLISGWLSNATFKNEMTQKQYVKKKLVRLMPAYIIAMMVTLISILLIARNDIYVWIQYGLDILTIGGWNPMLIWWTQNRPLWFISMLLTYHYVAPKYLKWLRNKKNDKL